jgi:hypothetical protein
MEPDPTERDETTAGVRGETKQTDCCCPREECGCCYETNRVFGKCSPIKIVCYIVYSISFVWLVVSSIVLRQTVFSSELHDVAWYVATVFVLMTLPLSAYEIGQHLMHFNDPEIQKYIVRILWMVPIYSVESLLALIWRDSKTVLETLREAYEAYVIFCLLQLMINTVARSPEQLQNIVDNKDPNDLHHMSFAKYCFKQWDHFDFFSKVRKGTLQYVVVKLLGTAIELITVSIEAPAVPVNTTGFSYKSISPSPSSSSDRCFGNEVEVPNYYCDGCFSRFDRAYIWVALATNFSQIWAMYCLVLFYHAFMKELKPINPLGKLLTVKAVVFFSFYQEVAVTGAVFMGWIKATQNPSSRNGCFSKDDVAKGFQDFLICIEMFVAAIVHVRVLIFFLRCSFFPFSSMFPKQLTFHALQRYSLILYFVSLVALCL